MGEASAAVADVYTAVLQWDASREQTDLTVSFRVDRVMERLWTVAEPGSVCPYDLLYEGELDLLSDDGRIDETLSVVASGDRYGWARVDVDVSSAVWNGTLEVDATDVVNLVVSMNDGALHGEIAIPPDDLGRW